MLKSILEYVLDESRLNCFFLTAAWLVPLAAGLFALFAYLILRMKPRRALLVAFTGLFGPLLLFLWFLYGKIIAIYGLDSVRGLLINIGLFVSIGLIIGFSVRRFKPWFLS